MVTVSHVKNSRQLKNLQCRFSELTKLRNSCVYVNGAKILRNRWKPTNCADIRSRRFKTQLKRKNESPRGVLCVSWCDPKIQLESMFLIYSRNAFSCRLSPGITCLGVLIARSVTRMVISPVVATSCSNTWHLKAKGWTRKLYIPKQTNSQSGFADCPLCLNTIFTYKLQVGCTVVFQTLSLSLCGPPFQQWCLLRGELVKQKCISTRRCTFISVSLAPQVSMQPKTEIIVKLKQRVKPIRYTTFSVEFLFYHLGFAVAGFVSAEETSDFKL